MLTKFKYFLWRVRYAFYAAKRLHCSPSFAWEMANADDSAWQDGETAKDAVDNELECWDDDGD